MLHLQTLLVYSLLGLLMFFFARKAENATNWLKTIYNILPILLYTIVIGLRYSVGVDWENYRETYESIHNFTFSEMLELRFEIGFTCMLFLCDFFNAPVYTLFTIIAFFQILLLHNAYKDEKNMPYIYLAFILSGIAIQGFCNLLRQDIAFCIFLIALKSSTKHKFLHYIFICAIAVCFHKSALILLPLYFLWVRRSCFFSNIFIQYGLLLICILSSFLEPVKFFSLYITDILTFIEYDNYVDVLNELKTNNIWGVTRYFILAANIVIITISNNMKRFYESELLNKSYDLYFIGICCYFLFMGNMMFGRITLYFTNFLFIIYGYALYYFIKQVYSLQNIIRQGIVSAMLVISFASLIYNCTRNTDAYVSYFQEELHPIKDNLRSNMFDNQIN